MNKKGFTLIELLAVIVILAVIALITTPLITNTIQTSRKNADRNSARSYVSTIEEKIAEAMLDYPNLVVSTAKQTKVGEFACTNCNGNKVDIEFKGTAPQKVELTWTEGKIAGKIKYTNGCWQINAKGELNDIEKTDTSFCR